MSAPPVLEIDGLTAGYDGAAVIRGLELAVQPGEVVALLGANGAGKTTTLRAVSGLVHPLEGSIRFAGQDLARVSASARARLGIAHVPEAEAGVHQDQARLGLDQETVAHQAGLRARVSADQAPSDGAHGGAIQMMDAHAFPFRRALVGVKLESFVVSRQTLERVVSREP